MAATNFVKLCTLTVNLDDVSSVPCEPTPDAIGTPTLVVKMRGAHNTLALTDPDDQAAILTAVGETESKNEFLKKHAENTKKKAKEEKAEPESTHKAGAHAKH